MGTCKSQLVTLKYLPHSNGLTFGSCAVAPEDFPPNRDGSDHYLLLRAGQPPGEFVVTAKPIPGFPPGCISLSDPQRTWCRISIRDTFTGEIFDPFESSGKAYLGSLDLEIGFASPNKKTEVPYDEDELSKIFVDAFQNQVLAPGQRILMDVRNVPLLIVVKTVGLVDLAMASDDVSKQVYREAHARGILTNQTRVLFHRDGKGDFNLKPSMSKPNSNAILAPDFKFEDMGIGGLGNEFSTIFRRAFASRVFPPGLVAKMGIPHVKGMLLYGPPGTGKTLIARQIGKMLNARPPKVINGPEVLNKYVGQSEENIRKLFADAEKEYKEKGDESSLHIIIFDELDAVCKQRGSGAGGGTGVGDSVVNQLLSKLDGVDELNNILLIGMTNRKDMIDDALLRPGRLEVHLEISLPDEPGRLEIFKIHTAKMRTNGLLDVDVNLQELAGNTKNYSGAEINGVVKAAASFAFSRHTEVGQMAAVKQDVANMKVNRADFMNALTEVRPAYGVSEAELDEAVRLGIIPYSQHVNATVQEMMRVVGMIREDPNKFNTSVLFHGPKGAGKTALAAHIALQSDFPFVKMVTPADLVGYRDDFAKKDYVHRAFADAYKSPASILILDDFERLIGWNPIGPRFSNTMLEALTTLIVSKPPKVRPNSTLLSVLFHRINSNQSCVGPPSLGVRHYLQGIRAQNARNRHGLCQEGCGTCSGERARARYNLAGIQGVQLWRYQPAHEQYSTPDWIGQCWHRHQDDSRLHLRSQGWWPRLRYAGYILGSVAGEDSGNECIDRWSAYVRYLIDWRTKPTLITKLRCLL